MLHVADKQLFTHPYSRRRRTPATDARRPQELGGQALAEAQRLSRPRLRAGMFVLLVVVSDLVLAPLSGFLAWALGPGMAAINGVAVAFLWAGTLFALAAIKQAGGYRPETLRDLPRSLRLGVMGLALGLFTVFMLLALSGRGGFEAGLWLGLWALLGLPMLMGARVMVWQRMRALSLLGLLEHRLVVVGGGPDLAATLRELDQGRRSGYRVCGFFDARRDARSPAVVAGHHKMGDLAGLVAFVRMAQIDTVIVALPQVGERRMIELLRILSAVPVEIRAVPAPGVIAPGRARRSQIGRVSLIELCRPPIGGVRAVQKRVFDLVAASVALVLLAPVLIGVAIAVRLDSPGPILFRQLRHGFNNRPIKVLKFRSMYADRCDPSAVKAVRRTDPRVTRVGRFIRRTSLDELPQLFNVIQGELSMVGPRPHATAARTGDILYDEVTAAYSARHRVKPGITGWAQINGWRGELNTAEKITARVECDLYYIENWSIWFDLKILLKTPAALIGAKNAY